MLRPYQLKCVEAVFREWEKAASTLVVMATGLGKTVTLSEIVRRTAPQRSIVIAHRSELIVQAARHVSLSGLDVQIEKAEQKASTDFFHKSPVVVASVQTLISGKEKKRMEKFDPREFGLLVIDECFPAGTLVDERPIETLKSGDRVMTHQGMGRVITTMNRRVSQLIRIYLNDGNSIVTTLNHPFWTLSGWKAAIDLTPNDMVLTITPNEQMCHLSVSDRIKTLQESGMQIRDVAPHYCRNIPAAWRTDHSLQEDKRNASPRSSGSCFNQTSGDGMETARSERKRTWANDSSNGTSVCSWLGNGVGDTNWEGQKVWIPDMLQSGCWESRPENSSRSGRELSLGIIPKGSGFKEELSTSLVRVAGYEILQRGCGSEFDQVCPGGVVYNLEVSNGNTYFANGVLVHNCHHAAASSYKNIIAHFRQNLDLKVFGCTATPDRSDELALGEIFESVAFNYGIAEAIQDGWLVPIEQQLVRVKSLDYSHVRTTAGDLNGADLAAVMEAEENLQGITAAAIEVIGNRKSIVFTSSVKHAEMCAEIFNRHRPGMAMCISGGTPEGERTMLLKDFAAGKFQVFVNCSIATEGFDCPDVQCIVMGKPTKSRSLYTQMCLDDSTEILTENGWKTRKTILPSDLVASFDMQSQEIAYVKILNLIDRPKHCRETMWGISSPMLDVRVTSGHSMVIRTKHGRRRTKSEWRKEDACTVPPSFSVPCAGFSNLPGVPLTLDELKFIGIVLTDGCINKANRAIQITQGEHQPWLSEIEDCIKNCGFKYTKSATWRKTQFNQTSRRVLFTISHGTPRGTNKHLTGWGKLDGFLDKNISERLMPMSTEQFRSFLYGLHIGDGIKHLNRDYTRRSYHIVSARKAFVDRLQQLCVHHGYASNSSIHGYNANPIWIVHIKSTPTRSILTGSSDNRPVWGLLESKPSERVWCVENELGTLVTRRNGKVCIMGNCGRGTRAVAGVLDDLHSAYERREAIAASVKPSCVVLDFVGNSGRHKLVTTADVLGGKCSEEAKESALKKAEKAEGPVRMDKLIEESEEEIRKRIEEARRQAEARRLRLVAKADYHIRTVDPFDTFDQHPELLRNRSLGPRFSEKQRNILTKLGVNLNEIGYDQGRAIIAQYFERIEKGLATPNQVKLLKRHGYNTKDMTMKEASKKIDALAKNGWKRPSLKPA